EEFDSFALNREKVVFGQAKANLFIGPLPPGRYPFFGQYHPTTAQGEVIVLPPGEEVPDAH
ncbi:MAG: cupredoxin domain-containing protein, partial [Pseudomonadota bacterium]|nr:cupredoxin domain-containing protein [Pseudomonadota bacterium]